MRTIAVLLTRDLRAHDNPALAAAARDAERVVPLFVLDDAILGGPFAAPNRLGFLAESLADLRRSLRGALVVRCGDPVAQVARVGADAVYLSADVSAYAQERERRLRARFPVETFAGVTAVGPGALAPAGRDHYRVFTPYWRAWRALPLRAVEAPPRIRLPDGIDPGALPADLVRGPRSPDVAAGGERAGRARMRAWLDDGLARYDGKQQPGLDATSRLSPYLHFGCVSAVELAHEALARGGEAFVRQLCWRDFYAQLLLRNPASAREDYRPRGDVWGNDGELLAAWREGRTGYPIVDAGMRQLAREGWLHNRARLIAASFLVKHLDVDWRRGARHFLELLVDGDVAQNAGNWQWVAGTGVDTRPNRVYNPTLQARRHDPDGSYVRRYVPELAGLADGELHEPWRLGAARLRELGYPEPVVDHAEATGRFRARRAAR